MVDEHTYMCYRFKEKMEEEFSTSHSTLGRYFLDWFHKLENSINGADSWFETSGVGLTEYWECEGNMLLSWKSGGYRQVLDLLMVRLYCVIFVYTVAVYHLLTLLSLDWPDPKTHQPLRVQIQGMNILPFGLKNIVLSARMESTAERMHYWQMLITDRGFICNDDDDDVMVEEWKNFCFIYIYIYIWI